MYDSYLKEVDATVTYVDNTSVELDQTVFFPASGGVQHDTGVLVSGNITYQVNNVIKQGDRVLHIVDKPGLKVGERVHGIIDWSG
jgi:Ser-tRNA(Ala) deacylase AlaX